MTEIEGLLKTLEIYIETEHTITQGFYQGLCMKAKEAIEQLQAENKRLQEENKGLISGHFCPSPQLSKLATTCDCAHSDRHRVIDWASIDKLQAENKQLKDNMAAASRILDAYFCAFLRNRNKEDELVVKAKQALKDRRPE